MRNPPVCRACDRPYIAGIAGVSVMRMTLGAVEFALPSSPPECQRQSRRPDCYRFHLRLHIQKSSSG